MGKRFAALLILLVAYLVPMIVGLTITQWAFWVFLPLIINIGFFSIDNDDSARLVGSTVVLIMGLTLASVLLFVSANSWLLWGTFAMLIVYVIIIASRVFEN